MEKISESIFSGATVVIPMNEVSHIKIHENCCGNTKTIEIITSATKYNQEGGYYENSIFLYDNKKTNEASNFMESWCYFRYEKDIKN